MTATGRRFAESALRAFAEAVLAGVGTGARVAEIVSSSLVEADRRGVHTHGLVRLPSYRDDVRSGRVVVAAVPRLVRDGGAVALIDGGGGFGAVTAVTGMDEAIARAERHGAAVVVARGGNHFGAAAVYALRAVERGLIGLVATSTPAVMAPWGGAEARIGNNPLAIAAPTPAGLPPFVLDFAQSATSRGRIKLAELAGEPIPAGWALDADGRSTTDATAALAGALLPFGGYKASGLALALEMLTGVLAGGDLGPELVNASLTGSASSSSAARVGTVGSLYLAVDPGQLVGRDAFAQRLARVLGVIKDTPPAEGFDEVFVPGELEAREDERARERGIELDEPTIAALRGLGAGAAVEFPDPTSPTRG
jgi:LDH2 family malate/lactate/ureidoglycolate dehydrogenase